MSTSSAGEPAPPAAEVAIDLALVRQLIRAQAPQWGHEEISYLATGWDNEVYRLGPKLIIRLPRRQLGQILGDKERKWLPRLAVATGVDLGLALFVGKPTAAYPFTFSVYPFVPGRIAAELPRHRRDEYAREFSDLLRSLHQKAEPSAPTSEFRGCPLATLNARTHKQIAALGREAQAPAKTIWEAALAAAPFFGAQVWLHGDPHPQNTIVNHSDPAALSISLIDFGDLCAGDPASDLGMFWMHFSPGGVAEAFAAYGVAEGSSRWVRSRGWALRYALITCGLDKNDPLGRVGRETLEILLAGERARRS